MLWALAAEAVDPTAAHLAKNPHLLQAQQKLKYGIEKSFEHGDRLCSYVHCECRVLLVEEQRNKNINDNLKKKPSPHLPGPSTVLRLLRLKPAL